MKKNRYKLFFNVGAVFVGLLLLTQFRDVKEKKVFRALVSPEKAQTIALNDLKTTQGGVELSHRNHFVRFGMQGVLFQPKKGPDWKWQLNHFGTQEESLKDVAIQSVKPENNVPQIVEYRYGNIIEEYHAKANTVEQRFVLEEPLALQGQNLVIRGRVECEGEFKKLKEGWAWKDDQGQVALGDVTVFDAQGKTLMAHMNVNAHQTEIIVNAKSLAEATYPVTIDPEIGANDFRISNMGPDGDDKFNASAPEVAYNSKNNEYLVVWSGDGLTNKENEIFGQRINAATGQEVGINDFRISDMGPDGNINFNGFRPSVAYNSKNNEFLVVWQADDNGLGLVDEEIEIYGQRIDAATGQEVGVNDFRISDMGPDGNPNFKAFGAVVAYNSNNNEYLVVWFGDDNIPPLVGGEREIFGQRLSATGVELGPNDFRISDIGQDGQPDFDNSLDPAVAYNSADDEYLVVWSAFDILIGDHEIFGQRIDGSTGAELGTNDFRISDMGPDGDLDFDFKPFQPAIAYNSKNNEYLVVWDASDNVFPLVVGEDEIFGQRIDGSTGAELGANDFRISNMGLDGDVNAFGFTSAVTYSPEDNEYLVVWSGDEGSFAPDSLDIEIYGQRLDGATGTKIGTNNFQISDVGPDGNFFFPATASAVAYSSSNKEYLVVWRSREDTLPDFSVEIFGQRIKCFITSDVDKLSLTSGGVQNLTLDFGPGFAGQHFLVLGSLSGILPGLPLGGKNIPLNMDAYFTFTLNNPNNSALPNGFGVLDALGRATAQFVLPAGLNLPSGTIVHHAAVVIDVQPTLVKISAVSNPEPCTLE